MSDKKMLNEAAVRKMMKLANIPSLTDKFIKENYFDYPVEEEMRYQRDEEEPMDEPAMDDAPMEEPEMEMDDEPEMMEDVNLQLSEDEIVQEVARRVAARILKAKKAQKEMNEALGK